MSIAYLDPGNIESDLQAGAVAEYKVSFLKISYFDFLKLSAVIVGTDVVYIYGSDLAGLSLLLFLYLHLLIPIARIIRRRYVYTLHTDV